MVYTMGKKKFAISTAAANAIAISTTVIGPTWIPSVSSWKKRINPAPAAGMGASRSRFFFLFLFANVFPFFVINM
jgi:hypothetical protein